LEMVSLVRVTDYTGILAEPVAQTGPVVYWLGKNSIIWRIKATHFAWSYIRVYYSILA